ncbi:MAG: hypothetical protein WA581_05195 [Candidatus Acidiferrales bacterium]
MLYLYYLPFCSVFTSKDNFHAQIVPLFLAPEQTFVNGTELKEDLAKLVAHYESLPKEVLKTGLIHFAAIRQKVPRRSQRHGCGTSICQAATRSCGRETAGRRN